MFGKVIVSSLLDGTETAERRAAEIAKVLAFFGDYLTPVEVDEASDEKRIGVPVRREPLRRECLSCGRLFVPTVCDDGRFCSSRCWIDSHFDRHRGGAWYRGSQS